MKRVYFKLIRSTLILFLPIIIAIIIVYTKFDLQTMILGTAIETGNFLVTICYSLLSNFGIVSLAIFITLILFLYLKIINKDKVFNEINEYLDIKFIFFWYGSRILGFGKCNLTQVPIFLQFKLFLNNTFIDYIFGSVDIFDNIDFEVTDGKSDTKEDTINFIVADTYNISNEMLPDSLKELNFIKIDRNKKDQGIRSYNSKFVNRIRKELHEIPPKYKRINMFLTTNAMHNERIVKDNFISKGRIHDRQLFIYQQSKEFSFKFSEKGIRVL